MADNKSQSMVGKIIAVLPERSGTSSRGGYRIQEYVVEETEGQYPKKMSFEVYGDKIDKFALQKDDVVEVYYNIDAHEYQGRWFNSIRAWSVRKFTVEKENFTRDEAKPEPTPTPKESTEPKKSMDVSDLPF